MKREKLINLIMKNLNEQADGHNAFAPYIYDEDLKRETLAIDGTISIGLIADAILEANKK